MSWLSDPDRLERLALYVMDDPPNALPREVADALNDAATRIRSLQAREVQLRRALIPEVIEQLERHRDLTVGCQPGRPTPFLDAIIAELRAMVEGRET